jgi:RimJ/RimL family protein N-acetyltransferase
MSMTSASPRRGAERGHASHRTAYGRSGTEFLAYSAAVAPRATIATPRLLLRPWQPDDLAEFTRLLTDPVVTRYIVVSTPFSPQDVAEVHARTLEQWERNGFGPWAAIEKATGRWVGRIGLDELPDWPGPHKVEVGWELHREFWGRGLATEAGMAGVRHGFEAVGPERIISATMATNAASRRVMEKCGLRFQGELPMAGTTVAWYAIDRADWQAGPVSAPEGSRRPRPPDPAGKQGS